MVQLAKKQGEKIILASSSEFFQCFQVNYCRRLCFSSSKIEQWVQLHSENVMTQGLLYPEQVCLGDNFSQEIADASMADVYIAHIDDQIGYGLFAASQICQSSLIGEYTGLVRKKRLLFSVSDHAFFYPFTSHFWFKYLVDARDCGNELRFVNHSDQPNTEVITLFVAPYLRLVFFALRNIEAHEELTFDYGPCYWRQRQLCKK